MKEALGARSQNKCITTANDEETNNDSDNNDNRQYIKHYKTIHQTGRNTQAIFSHIEISYNHQFQTILIWPFNQRKILGKKEIGREIIVTNDELAQQAHRVGLRIYSHRAKAMSLSLFRFWYGFPGLDLSNPSNLFRFRFHFYSNRSMSD